MRDARSLDGITAQPISALKWDVVLFGFGRFGFGGSRSRSRRGSGCRGTSSRRVGESTAVGALRINERKALQHNLEFALLLVGILVFPLIEFEAAIYQKRAPFP